MFARLLLLFVAVPFIELFLLLKLADITSPVATLLLVVFTGIVGAWLARLQGWQTAQRIQQELAAQRMPTTSLADGGMILVAACLLVTPGVLTDLFGFSLLMPPIRRIYRGWLIRHFKHSFEFRAVNFDGEQPWSPDKQHPANSDKIIDSYVVDRHE